LLNPDAPIISLGNNVWPEFIRRFLPSARLAKRPAFNQPFEQLLVGPTISNDAHNKQW